MVQDVALREERDKDRGGSEGDTLGGEHTEYKKSKQKCEKCNILLQYALSWDLTPI